MPVIAEREHVTFGDHRYVLVLAIPAGATRSELRSRMLDPVGHHGFSDGVEHSDRCHGVRCGNGAFQVPSSAADSGQYSRSTNTNGPSGAGNQLDSLSAPGDSFWT